MLAPWPGGNGRKNGKRAQTVRCRVYRCEHSADEFPGPDFGWMGFEALRDPALAVSRGFVAGCRQCSDTRSRISIRHAAISKEWCGFLARFQTRRRQTG